MPPHDTLISAFDVQDVHRTSTVVCATRPETLLPVSLRLFQNLPDGQLIVPALREDIIAIRLHGVTDVTSRITRRFARCRSQPGDVLILPHGIETAWEWTSENSILHLVFEPCFLGRVAAEVNDTDPVRFELVEAVAANDELVRQIGLALLAELQSGGLAGRLFVESLAQTLAIHLLRKHAVMPREVRDPAARLSNLSLRRVADYINAHLAEELDLASIAAVTAYSPYHLARLFKRATGQTLHQYVIARRVAVAKDLLAMGQLTVAEVAACVGFYDQSHLSRHFKQTYGVLPRDVRAQRKSMRLERRSIRGTVEEDHYAG